MGARLVLVAVAVLVIAAGPVSGAPAAGHAPAAEMVLGLEDFPNGATLVTQAPTRIAALPGLAHSSAYTRSFRAVDVDGIHLATLVSSALSVTHVSAAREFMSALASATSSPLARAGLVEAFTRRLEALAGAKLKTVSARLVRAQALQAGAQAVELVFSLAAPSKTLEVGEIYVREGAGLGLISYLAQGAAVPPAEDLSLARKVAAHIDVAVAAPAPTSAPPSGTVPPSNRVPPAISGTLSPGGVLTALPGTWVSTSNASYRYQWYVCSGEGGVRRAIPGATSVSYTVAADQTGRSFAVAVSVTTPAGTATVISRTTTPVA